MWVVDYFVPCWPVRPDWLALSVLSSSDHELDCLILGHEDTFLLIPLELSHALNCDGQTHKHALCKRSLHMQVILARLREERGSNATFKEQKPITIDSKKQGSIDTITVLITGASFQAADGCFGIASTGIEVSPVHVHGRCCSQRLGPSKCIEVTFLFWRNPTWIQPTWLSQVLSKAQEGGLWSKAQEAFWLLTTM